jgi:hypothetical protein
MDEIEEEDDVDSGWDAGGSTSSAPVSAGAVQQESVPVTPAPPSVDSSAKAKAERDRQRAARLAQLLSITDDDFSSSNDALDALGDGGPPPSTKPAQTAASPAPEAAPPKSIAAAPVEPGTAAPEPVAPAPKVASVDSARRSRDRAPSAVARPRERAAPVSPTAGRSRAAGAAGPLVAPGARHEARWHARGPDQTPCAQAHAGQTQRRPQARRSASRARRPRQTIRERPAPREARGWQARGWQARGCQARSVEGGASQARGCEASCAARGCKAGGCEASCGA